MTPRARTTRRAGVLARSAAQIGTVRQNVPRRQPEVQIRGSHRLRPIVTTHT
jgi:hypothetical protein